MQFVQNEVVFLDQLSLLEDESTQAGRIFGPNTLVCQSLQVQEFSIRDDMRLSSGFLQSRQTGHGKSRGRGKPFAKHQHRWTFGIVEHERKSWEQLIVESRQLVLTLRAFGKEQFSQLKPVLVRAILVPYDLSSGK
jgi:hypothetical protein